MTIQKEISRKWTHNLMTWLVYHLAFNWQSITL